VRGATLIRSAIASLIATGCELGLLSLLVRRFDVPHWVGYFSVQFVANAIGFLLYKFWAFRAGRQGSLPAQYVRQLVLFGVSLLLNTGVSSLFSYRLGLEPELAFVLSNVIVYLGWNYPGNRYWVFRSSVHT
jgi:putative flippase GtrA